MMLFFKNPKNKKSTGILYLQTLLHERLSNVRVITSTIMIIKRYFNIMKSTEVAIFLPFTFSCIFAKKNDLVIMPDDSIRSITSVSKVRYENKKFLKWLFQNIRLIITKNIISLKKDVVYLTVSKDDQWSLQSKFPKHKIVYIPHPIQSASNKEGVLDRCENISTICFMNLQEHYSVNPSAFIRPKTKVNLNDLHNKVNIIFHGSYSQAWYGKYMYYYGKANCKAVRYVEDFEQFYNNIDLIILPLAAGAGIKNIVLNSVYRNKLILGTEEAFSGIPKEFTRKLIIDSNDDILTKINSEVECLAIKESCNILRDYLVVEHTEKAFMDTIFKNI
ncbi:glycosyl hydrolase family 1, partial [Escherichia coli]|nr:glycosyl hydrolase family 1 [Escherichia coli]